MIDAGKPEGVAKKVAAILRAEAANRLGYHEIMTLDADPKFKGLNKEKDG